MNGTNGYENATARSAARVTSASHPPAQSWSYLRRDCGTAEGAEIHWGDESGLRSDDVRGRSYAPKGETPVLRVSNKRHGLSVISTVTNKGEMRWKIFDGALNADLKQAVTKLAPARTKLQLVKATSSHLRSVQRRPARVRKYFEHEPIRYAA
jgi:hypothetical protein